MEKTARPLRFLNSPAARILSVALIIQGLLLYAVSRPEIVPQAPPLSAFPANIGDWSVKQEGYVDQETRDVLQADDLLSREYARPTDTAATNLFVAAFRSQRTGKAPHSPKNCLPGAGWVQDNAALIQIDVPNYPPIVVNRYIVSKGGYRSVVLYWYQSWNRAVASEYRAKIYVVADSIRYNRTDTALVRVVTPVVEGNDAAAVKVATDFVKATYPALRAALPN
jgi:EpsI family protein